MKITSTPINITPITSNLFSHGASVTPSSFHLPSDHSNTAEWRAKPHGQAVRCGPCAPPDGCRFRCHSENHRWRPNSPWERWIMDQIQLSCLNLPARDTISDSPEVSLRDWLSIWLPVFNGLRQSKIQAEIIFQKVVQDVIWPSWSRIIIQHTIPHENNNMQRSIECIYKYVSIRIYTYNHAIMCIITIQVHTSVR